MKKTMKQEYCTQHNHIYKKYNKGIIWLLMICISTLKNVYSVLPILELFYFFDVDLYDLFIHVGY